MIVRNEASLLPKRLVAQNEAPNRRKSFNQKQEPIAVLAKRPRSDLPHSPLPFSHSSSTGLREPVSKSQASGSPQSDWVEPAMTWGGVGEWVRPGSGDSGGRVRLTVRVVTGPTSLVGCSRGGAPLLTRVSLHNVQVFRLLLKTSVERNANELTLFLAGSAVWPSLVRL